MAPSWVLDYIVVHEMSHMIVMDHSKEFWALIENMNKYMKSNKMKQKAIVNRTVMQKDKISRIFRGASEPNITELEEIAAALGKKISDFEEEIIVNVEIVTEKVLPQPHFCMGEITDQRKNDSVVYLKFAERIQYLHSIANAKVTIEEEF